MAERKRKYQDVENLLKQNPGMSISDAGRQLGYERELQDKGGGRVGLRNRHVDGVRTRAEAVQRGDAPRYKPPSVPGFDRHHKRMIMLYKPLFEGLSDADALALSKHAAAQGMNLGDVDSNFEYLSKDSHNRIHRYMERQGMRPRDMPDFSKADLPNRKKAFDVLYKDFIQTDIDKELARLNANSQPVKLKPGLNGDIHLPTLRTAVRGLAAGGVVALGPLGTAASASETAIRTQIADKTKNPLDRFQAILSGFSLAADAASYAPPATIPATVASTVADVANASIDTGRDIYKTLLGK
jgi:hypothetical protein